MELKFWYNFVQTEIQAAKGIKYENSSEILICVHLYSTAHKHWMHLGTFYDVTSKLSQKIAQSFRGFLPAL